MPLVFPRDGLGKNGTCDIDQGVEGAEGARTSNRNIKHQSMQLEPRVFVGLGSWACTYNDVSIL